jgi:hypothetical protein
MNFRFEAKVWYWKGPAPHYFVTVPESESAEIKAVEKLVTYGWGMIPACVRVGGSEWSTALWPKDGRYIVPLKSSIRKAEGLEEGDLVQTVLTLDLGPKN